ncbi:MAG TPA: hypothetical protein VD833_00035 [Vicinamibacterales bacterium]|nr:hypothetical protein [Vicinamibacterales bacterium]
MSERAEFPTSGSRPSSHAEAAEAVARGAARLAALASEKRIAATRNQQASRSDANARRARAEGWSGTAGPSHTPNQ